MSVSEETRMLGSLVLELQVVVSCPIMGVWGTKLRSSGESRKHSFPLSHFSTPLILHCWTCYLGVLVWQNWKAGFVFNVGLSDGEISKGQALCRVCSVFVFYTFPNTLTQELIFS